MKKMLLLLVCLTTFAWLHAEEAPAYTYQFGPKLNTASTQVYTTSAKFTVVNNDIPMQFVAFNNNNTSQSGKGTWTYIRCGGSKNTNGVTATATNQIAIPKAIGKIVINAQRYKSGTKDNATSAKLLVSANSDLSNATSYDLDFNSLTTTATDITIDIDNPAVDLFYQINIVLPKCDNNGWLQFNEISFYEAIITPTNQVATPEFDPVTETAVEAGDKVTISCATDGASIYYTTDETDPTVSSTLYDASTGIIVNEAMTIKAIAVKEGLEDSAIASATYTIKKPVVATPTFDPAPGAVKKGTEVTITCATEGATLMYQVNGDIQEGASPVTVVINEATTIEVIASKDGYVDSEATAKYTIIGEVETAPQAFFDFTKPKDLGLTAEKDTPISGKAITVNGISVTFSKGTSTDAKVWENNGYHIRVYQGATITVSAGEGQSIESIQFKGATLFRILYNGTAIAKSGETTVNWWNPTLNQRAATNEVQFTVDNSGRVDINSINVNDPVVTGVEDVTVDENAPVEYYNLQGVRVANPENGIYIRRQGSKVSKVLVK